MTCVRDSLYERYCALTSPEMHHLLIVKLGWSPRGTKDGSPPSSKKISSAPSNKALALPYCERLLMSHADMSRRQLLAAAAVAPLATLATVAGSTVHVTETTIVLVHGAWHSGWCWKKLVPLLRGAGHQVITPTMTGLGERAHLLAASVDSDTHVRDIVAVLESDNLQRVMLVGHSYRGMVITGVAQRVPERVASMVYLAAVFPEDGKALSDYAPVPATRADGWRVPPPGPPGQHCRLQRHTLPLNS